ncbi:hypothetical protein BU16DRAFT_532492 [Lophium mytilinum]|uniref:Uncharacterized protein n=1 Tax=Lophium mytilinum TaxID=390894 RepID=A0A6A6RCJ6_9PEZI|nr:hypothetical protein BU16DRAFT_532492 [Lophium mytilinum]
MAETFAFGLVPLAAFPESSLPAAVADPLKHRDAFHRSGGRGHCPSYQAINFEQRLNAFISHFPLLSFLSERDQPAETISAPCSIDHNPFPPRNVPSLNAYNELLPLRDSQPDRTVNRYLANLSTHACAMADPNNSHRSGNTSSEWSFNSLHLSFSAFRPTSQGTNPFETLRLPSEESSPPPSVLQQILCPAPSAQSLEMPAKRTVEVSQRLRERRSPHHVHNSPTPSDNATSSHSQQDSTSKPTAKQMETAETKSSRPRKRARMGSPQLPPRPTHEDCPLAPAKLFRTGHDAWQKGTDGRTAQRFIKLGKPNGRYECTITCRVYATAFDPAGEVAVAWPATLAEVRHSRSTRTSGKLSRSREPGRRRRRACSELLIFPPPGEYARCGGTCICPGRGWRIVGWLDTAT